MIHIMAESRQQGSKLFDLIEELIHHLMLDEKVTRMSNLYGVVKVVERVGSAIVPLLHNHEKLVEGFALDLVVLGEVR